MDFAADFTAIDFETASRQPDSACQLGMVRVRGGRIVDQATWLIRPMPLFFHRRNIEIHGITPDQVRGEPQFGELWPEIAEKLGEDCIVAHNASFDMRVLIASLRAHDQAVPDLGYTCTRAIAKRTWPHHRGYGLKPLSNWLGIRFRHHDALEDSVACAKILLAAGIDREATSLPDLEKRLKLRRGTAGEWGMRGPSGSSRKRRPTSDSQSPASNFPFLMPNDVIRPKSSGRTASRAGYKPDEVRSSPASTGNSETSRSESIDLQRLMVRAEFIRPLEGKLVVVTGRFRALSRDDACSLASRSGATCQDTVDESTDLLVIGDQPKSNRASRVEEPSVDNQETSGDIQDPVELKDQIEKRNAEGNSIRVLSEQEFIELVGSPVER